MATTLNVGENKPSIIKLVGVNMSTLIGAVITLDEDRHQLISQRFEITLPESHKSKFDELVTLEYLAFLIDGKFRSVAKIAEWRLSGANPVKRVAWFESMSTSVGPLQSKLPDNRELLWLVEDQREAVDKVLLSKDTQHRPTPLPPCLDLEEASSAVARRYGVHSDQVNIAIHRRALGSRSNAADET